MVRQTTQLARNSRTVSRGTASPAASAAVLPDSNSGSSRIEIAIFELGEALTGLEIVANQLGAKLVPILREGDADDEGKGGIPPDSDVPLVRELDAIRKRANAVGYQLADLFRRAEI